MATHSIETRMYMHRPRISLVIENALPINDPMYVRTVMYFHNGIKEAILRSSTKLRMIGDPEREEISSRTHCAVMV